MSYLTEDAVSANASMQNRVAQAAAHEGLDSVYDPATGQPMDPDRWSYINRRDWASAPGWGDAWASALVGHPEPEYDPGSDEGVITDSMILSQVQAMI